MKASGSTDGVTLAVLAGGRGTRLGGVAKGLIEVGGVPILERLLLALGPITEDVLLVTDDPSPYARFGLRAVPDEQPGHGAPGGLYTALVHARTDRVLLVACDMPFVSVAAVELLRDACRRDAAPLWVCFEREGRLEPMPGLYARALARPLGDALSENPSFQQVLRRVQGCAVPVSALCAREPGAASLVSINTPGDLSRAGGALPVRRGDEPR
ncbi:MAG: molybdenum cofactor guanylyltransferase [Myxococcaceae bacterium]|nr:molybdenum cofactor guanylyltransferase [Myxococcaceae bacterium]